MKDKKCCRVCGKSSGEIRWSYGAVACVACIKFFLRCAKGDNKNYDKCISNESCIIDEFSLRCQSCRLKKCKMVGMHIKKKNIKVKTQKLICSACEFDDSTGIHYGAQVCEACKVNFFIKI